MRILLPLLSLLFLLVSCGKENKPKVSYEEAGDNSEVVIDSNRVLMSDLPVQIDSIPFLMHPIGNFKLYGIADRYSGFGTSGGSGGSGSYNILNPAAPDTFWGELFNVKFQHIDSDTLTSLTDKNIRIFSLSFLRQIFENTGQDYLVYSVNDADTNRDGKIDGEDLNTLYMSRTNGTGFIKISPDAHEAIDWRSIPAQDRLYFRSIEDANRNGKFEKEDQLHYFYIDLNEEELTAVEYFPL